jgi:hypothetical protein
MATRRYNDRNLVMQAFRTAFDSDLRLQSRLNALSLRHSRMALLSTQHHLSLVKALLRPQAAISSGPLLFAAAPASPGFDLLTHPWTPGSHATELSIPRLSDGTAASVLTWVHCRMRCHRFLLHNARLLHGFCCPLLRLPCRVQGCTTADVVLSRLPRTKNGQWPQHSRTSDFMKSCSSSNI